MPSPPRVAGSSIVNVEDYMGSIPMEGTLNPVSLLAEGHTQQRGICRITGRSRASCAREA